jgi:hypothetical protein
LRLKKLTSVDQLYVTCSMTPDSQDIGADELASAHRRTGYSKIAIHFVIRRDGTVEPGRPLDEPGALSRNANSHTYQVCLIGGLNDHLEPYGSFTTAQRDALAALADVYRLPMHYGPESPLKTLY